MDVFDGFTEPAASRLRASALGVVSWSLASWTRGTSSCERRLPLPPGLARLLSRAAPFVCANIRMTHGPNHALHFKLVGIGSLPRAPARVCPPA